MDIKDYRNSLDAASFILSDTGKNIFNERYSLIENIVYQSKIDTDFLVDMKLEEDPTLYKDSVSLKQLMAIRESLSPQTDLELIAEVNDKINIIIKKAKDISFYDPIAYFNVYFNQIENGQVALKDSFFRIVDVPNTDNKTFDTWFEGSEVVDIYGFPKTVYHGRYNAEVTEFKFDKFPAKYFAENESYARWFANASSDGKEGTLYVCYLRILNPLDLTEFGTRLVSYDDFTNLIELKYGYKLPENKMLRELATEQGGKMWTWKYLRNGVNWLKFIRDDGKFDGIHFYENNPSDYIDEDTENTTPAWIVFRPEQIKLKNSNILRSLESKDIRFNEGGKL